MALIAFNGFDENVQEPGFSGTATRITGRRASSQCTNQATRHTLPAPVGELVVGAACEPLNAPPRALFSFFEGTTQHVTVTAEANGGVGARMGTMTGTLMAAGPNTVPMQSIWNYVEVHIKIHDTLGFVRVWVNGELQIDYAGDTRNASGTAAGAVSIIEVGTGGQNLVDDYYVLDTTGPAPYNARLGDVKVETLLPNGNGASSGWVGSDGNSVDNYLLVDEPFTPSATDYVAATASGAKDLYQMTDLETVGGTVLAVQPQHFVAASDAGTAPGYQPVLRKADGTEKAQATISGLSTTYSIRLGAIELTDPAGAAWTTATVNGLQVGAKIV